MYDNSISEKLQNAIEKIKNRFIADCTTIENAKQIAAKGPPTGTTTTSISNSVAPNQPNIDNCVDKKQSNLLNQLVNSNNAIEKVFQTLLKEEVKIQGKTFKIHPPHIDPGNGNIEIQGHLSHVEFGRDGELHYELDVDPITGEVDAKFQFKNGGVSKELEKEFLEIIQTSLTAPIKDPRASIPIDYIINKIDLASKIYGDDTSSKDWHNEAIILLVQIIEQARSVALSEGGFDGLKNEQEHNAIQLYINDGGNSKN